MNSEQKKPVQTENYQSKLRTEGSLGKTVNRELDYDEHDERDLNGVWHTPGVLNR